MKLSSFGLALGMALTPACAGSSNEGSPLGAGGRAGAGGSAGGVSASGGFSGGAGPSGSPSDVLCGTRPGGSPSGTQTLRFESESQNVVVQIVRREDGVGVGESHLYGLDAFALVIDGKTHCMNAQSELTYENSHHNWLDRAAVEIEGVHYELELTYALDEVAARWEFALVGIRGDAVVLERTELTRTGGPLSCFHCPGFLPVYVSEFQVQNTSTHLDEAGEYEPWIELFNPSAEAIDLTGWSLSNQFGERRLWEFRELTIARHGFVVVFADGEPEEGPLHTTFTLAAEGGEFVLTAPDGTTDGGFPYGSVAADESSIYDPLAATYISTAAPSPGAANPNMTE